MLGKVLGEISIVLTTIDDFVWGIPLIVLILSVGIYLTIRLKGLQITKMPMAIRHIRDNEKTGEHGEVSSFGALCTALSATIGTGNIVGVATALVIPFTCVKVPIPKRPTPTPKNAKIFASHFQFFPIPFSM